MLPFACSGQRSLGQTVIQRVFGDQPTIAVPVTQSPGHSSTFSPDFDDDFVPYNYTRHDEFDWKLIKAILPKYEDSNIIISPFSVKFLMSLLAEAAGKGTTTESELTAGVLPGVGSVFQARELYSRILSSLQTPTEDYDFKIATKIYVDTFVVPKQRYASIIESYYFTKIEQIEFSQADKAADKINAWVSEVTRNQIPQLVTKDDLDRAVMVILNAIYFRGQWRRPFFDNGTFEAPFFHGAKQPVRTTFMSQTGYFFFLESELLDAKILRLPYIGRKFAMSVILPNNADAKLDALLERLDSTTLQRSQYYMDEVEVRIEMPKFTFDHTTHLNDVLQELGIQAIFTNDASLPLLARGSDVTNRLQVSKVVQKAGISVTEEGSTVYAATEVVLTNKFGGDSTREFIANRPFVFLIEDESTGTLLFAGKVTNPTEFKH